MNTINRIFVISTLLSVIIGSTAALFVLTQSPETAIAPARTFVSWLEQSMTNASFEDRLSFAIGLGGLIWLFLGIVLLWEFRRTSPQTVHILSRENDLVEVEVDTVSERLAYHLSRLSDVYEVHPVPQSRWNKICVQIEVIVAPVVHMPMKGKEIHARTQEIIEDEMGLRAGEIRILLKSAPLPQDISQRQSVKLA